MSEIHLKITGMTCGHCVRAVTKALEGVSGVEKGQEKLVVHGQARAAALIAAVKEEGYDAAVQD